MRKKRVHAVGKRKRSVARAYAVQGSGKVIVNGKSINDYHPVIAKLLIREPLIIGNDIASKLDIKVVVKGGGIYGQASAARQAIAKCLVEASKPLKQRFLDYDRSLLVADTRRTEPHKPSRSKCGPRRHKQRSKR